MSKNKILILSPLFIFFLIIMIFNIIFPQYNETFSYLMFLTAIIIIFNAGLFTNKIKSGKKDKIIRSFFNVILHVFLVFFIYSISLEKENFNMISISIGYVIGTYIIIRLLYIELPKLNNKEINHNE